MWVRFIDDFDWRPRCGVTVAYKAGMTLNVTRACAVAAGSRAVPVSQEERDGKA